MQEITVVNSFFEVISTHDLINLDHTIQAQLPATSTFHNIIKGQSEPAPMTAPVGRSVHRTGWMIRLFFIHVFTLR